MNDQKPWRRVDGCLPWPAGLGLGEKWLYSNSSRENIWSKWRTINRRFTEEMIEFVKRPWMCPMFRFLFFFNYPCPHAVDVAIKGSFVPLGWSNERREHWSLHCRTDGRWHLSMSLVEGVTQSVSCEIWSFDAWKCLSTFSLFFFFLFSLHLLSKQGSGIISRLRNGGSLILRW